MPVPFKGGNISNEKAVLSLLFINSITFIGLISIATLMPLNMHIVAKIAKKTYF